MVNLFVQRTYKQTHQGIHYQSVLMSAHKLNRTLQGNQGGMRCWAAGLHSWASPHEPLCEPSCHICITLAPLAWLWLAVLSAGSLLYQRPTAEVFYILYLLMKSHFANQIQPSTDLATMFDSYCNYWECLLAQNNRGKLICLQRLSKHLWVADKNTQGGWGCWWGHIFPCWPPIKSHLDGVSCSSSAPVSLSSFSVVSFSHPTPASIESLQSWKGNKSTHFY